MKTPRELRAAANRAQYETLVADAELALTFVRVAAASSDAKIRKRRRDEAAKACELIEQRMPMLELDTLEADTLAKLLSQLISSLAALES